MNWVEALAVALALGYVILAIRQHSACWLLSALASVLYIGIFWKAKLYMESGLQLLYIALSAYGYWQWQRGRASDAAAVKPLCVTRWPLEVHAACALLVLGTSAISGYLLATYSDAAFPYIDSLTTWASVLTTIMVARKVLENWLYWIAIDAVSGVLYWQRDLHLTAGLFALYLVLAAIGYVQWKRSFQSQAR